MFFSTLVSAAVVLVAGVQAAPPMIERDGGASTIDVTLWKLPNYQAGDGTSSAGHPFPINVGSSNDNFLPSYLNNTVESATVPNGYICLFYGDAWHQLEQRPGCYDPPQNNMECVDYRGKSTMLYPNIASCIRCFYVAPDAICPIP